MNKQQASKYLTQAGFPGLFIDKAEGVWYLLGDEGVVDQSVERCLHAVRLEDVSVDMLRSKLCELADLNEDDIDRAVRGNEFARSIAFDGEPQGDDDYGW